MNNKKIAKILDGRSLAEKIKSDLKKVIAQSGEHPGLAAILVGQEPASELYLRLKEKASREVGIDFHKYLCDKNVSEKELLKMIKFLNQDNDIHGIIVQLPLPQGFNRQKIIDAIDPPKDVDGFHPQTKGIIPPTVAAIIELLKATEEELGDKSAVIIGKSDVFINGLKKHLQNDLGIKKIASDNAIPADCEKYDIIIIALGQAKALKKSMVKTGAIVIDVGISRIGEKTVGDVEPKVATVAGWLSPVPGGVGPLTVACLLKNTYLLSKIK